MGWYFVLFLIFAWLVSNILILQFLYSKPNNSGGTTVPPPVRLAEKHTTVEVLYLEENRRR